MATETWSSLLLSPLVSLIVDVRNFINRLADQKRAGPLLCWMSSLTFALLGASRHTAATEAPLETRVCACLSLDLMTVTINWIRVSRHVHTRRLRAPIARLARRGDRHRCCTLHISRTLSFCRATELESTSHLTIEPVHCRKNLLFLGTVLDSVVGPISCIKLAVEAIY